MNWKPKSANIKIGVALLTVAIGSACADNSVKRVPQVSVGVNQFMLKLTNTGERNPADTTLTVYINGMPPSAYKSTVRLPAMGEDAMMALSDFSTKSGERFNPQTQAVTQVWVGGGGYDYRSFKVQ